MVITVTFWLVLKFIIQDGRWKSAVNTVNPLGSKGLVAQAFSSIVRDMWRGEYTYFSPTSFRVGKIVRWGLRSLISPI